MPDLFAPLCPSGTRLGPVTPEATAVTGLPPSAQVAVGGHDHVCGALAVGVVEPGVMLDSMGTAEALCIPLEQPITDPALGRQGYTQGAHVVAGHYYVFGGQYTSGASVDWWRGVLGKEVGCAGQQVSYATLIAEAEQVPPGSLGVCFLPHLRRANPPYQDPKGRGARRGPAIRPLRSAVAPLSTCRAVCAINQNNKMIVSGRLIQMRSGPYFRNQERIGEISR